MDGDRGSAGGFDVRDVLAIVKRRKWHFAIPTLLVLAVAVPVTFLLRPEYESKAIILIEQPDIPPNLVSSTVTTYADQRIKVIEQRFKATTNLLRIIDKYNLYPDQRDVTPTSDIIDGMRDKIDVQLINASVIGPSGGRPHDATIAFSVGFDYSDPATAQKVASELVSWYLNENTRERQEQAEQTASFLSNEAASLERTVADLETKVTKFKEANAGSLPSDKQANLDALDRAVQEQREIDLRNAALVDRRSAIDMELAYLDSYAPPTAAGDGAVLSPAMQLKAARAKLESLKGRYADTYPDVVRTRNEIAALEKQVAADRKNPAKAGDDATTAASGDPSSPRRLQLKVQLQAIETEEKSLDARRKYLGEQINSLRDHLAKTPAVEQEFSVLSRALENAQSDYLSVRGKRLAAELGQSLEDKGKSERFEVIEPPQRPVEPAKPKRLLILAGSVAFAFAAGAGVVILAELLDPTIRSEKYLVARTGFRPLVMVPYIRTREEIVRAWVHRVGVSTALVASIVGCLAYVNYKVKPLDVAFANLERKFDAQVTRILR